VNIKASDSLLIEFPRIVKNPDSITGEIWLYSAADKFADIRAKISLNDSFCQSFDLKKLKRTKYEIILDWQAEGKAYFQKELFFPGN
jgi:hypothetical protein